MPNVARSRTLHVAVALFLPWAVTAAQPHQPVTGGTHAASVAAEHDTLRLYYLGYAIGREQYSLESSADGIALQADFDYVDRGRRTHLQGAIRLAPDYSMRQLEVARLGDSSRTVETRVDVAGAQATVRRRETVTPVALPAVAFAISPYAPVSQHLALLRYWKAHGSPPTVAVVPGGPTNMVRIWRSGRDTVRSGAQTVVLDRYAVDGVVWGIEYAWLDGEGRLAAFTTAGGGGLSMEAIRLALEPAYPELMRRAAAAAIADLERMSHAVRPIAGGSVALVGATLIDGTGAAPVPDATVVVDKGKIVAAGATAMVHVPSAARRIDVRGKTIIPGLWDMHTHLNQIEWAPVYLAAGVTTVRDMGNEIPFITALRRAVHSGRAVGPRMLLAGLVDGGGPNAFGAVNAATPDEGRRAVQRYHALGFEQMKLYSLLKPDVVGAITREAHRLGMTVTGHVPTSLSLLAAVDSGMDHIAHQPVRGDPASDSVRQVIASLKAHGTVIDPTASWGELLGHSTALPVSSFQPVIDRLPAVLAQRVVAMGTAAVDPATAAARLDRTLSIIGALHRAGVPIVAGTDEGIPGFSVYREIELYAKAGMSPMEAIRSATAVAAKAMHLDGTLGTIEPGKAGDLVVLDASPLDDIANIRTVRLVVNGGQVWESDALWRMAGFAPAGSAPPPGEARTSGAPDLVLTNAKVVTLDSVEHGYTAVAIAGGRIAALGTAVDPVWLRSQPRVLDLHGAVLASAFTDHHVHLFNVGMALLNRRDHERLAIDLTAARSLADVRSLVRARAAVLPPGAWVLGTGWSQAAWGTQALPTAADLDGAAGGHPVFLARTDGHASWLDAAALAAAHIERATRSPPGGEIVRLPSGEPSGVLLERANEPVTPFIPPPADSDVVAAYRTAAAALAERGVTEVYDAGPLMHPGVVALNLDLARYLRLLLRADSLAPLPLRVNLMIPAPSELADSLLAAPRSAMELSPRVRVTHIKLFADGALGSRGAALTHRYADDTTTRGVARMTTAQIVALGLRALDRGLGVATHAIGDEAVRRTLDAYETILRVRPGVPPRRLRIEHFSYARDEDFARAVRLGVILSVQSDFNAYTGDTATLGALRLGTANEPRVYNWARLARMGAVLAEGSDAFNLPGSALSGFAATLARRYAVGASMPDSLARPVAYRMNATRFAPDGTRGDGILRVGAPADLVAWSADPFTVPRAALDSIVATTVIHAGRVVVPSTPLTARQVVARIMSELKGHWTDDGIDSFKDGDPDTPVTGVAVTMMATMDVLQRASAAGLNLVITHEPTFYSHEDRLAALEASHDSVTAAKRAFIRAHHLVVFRLHDHWHYPARSPDPVVTGVFRALGWQRYQRTPEANVIELPATTLGALAADVAAKLGAHAMRVVGDPAMRVSKVAFLPGAAGFPAQRATLARDDVDVLLIGEAREWETVPWAADAITQGKRKALIVIGHVPSEQAGSDELARWVQPLVPGLPVKLVAAADPFWSPK